VEHIIPESLGNWEHVLPPGVVCDKCNNYLGRKVEAPLLDTVYFRDMRWKARLKTKRGRSPSVLGIDKQSVTAVSLYADVNGQGHSIGATFPEEESAWIKNLLSRKRMTVVIPIPRAPEKRLMSRFLGKVAVEAMALRLLQSQGGLRELIEKKDLNPLRNHVRRGWPERVWHFHERMLYPADCTFYEPGHGVYEVLNEWIFLYTQEQELYFVLALFGMEYSLNLAAPVTYGYEKWLAKNGGDSPLYPHGCAGRL